MNTAHERRLEWEYGYCEPDMLGLDMDGVDAVIEDHEADPAHLMQILLDIQAANGWLPEEILDLVAQRLEIPLAQVQHTVGFYRSFTTTPRGRHRVHVCVGTACHVNGGQRVLETAEDILGLKPGERNLDMAFSLETVNCLGNCALAPVMAVDDTPHGHMSPKETALVLSACK